MTSAVHSADLFSGFLLQSLNQTGELLLCNVVTITMTVTITVTVTVTVTVTIIMIMIIALFKCRVYLAL